MCHNSLSSPCDFEILAFRFCTMYKCIYREVIECVTMMCMNLYMYCLWIVYFLFIFFIFCFLCLLVFNLKTEINHIFRV